ncbi:unnamed protein product [Nesidiocoris tenuis]|uniref:Armadillo repeat-containing domain-containing protein n=1 Tax=Nesidiocoris tenuis TaxID=355587 RepID=A0A6H5GZ51_9HEMI|nr:unnamed protein product [Nesidiocoris tenuis]
MEGYNWPRRVTIDHGGLQLTINRPWNVTSFPWRQSKCSVKGALAWQHFEFKKTRKNMARKNSKLEEIIRSEHLSGRQCSHSYVNRNHGTVGIGFNKTKEWTQIRIKAVPEEVEIEPPSDAWIQQNILRETHSSPQERTEFSGPSKLRSLSSLYREKPGSISSARNKNYQRRKSNYRILDFFIEPNTYSSNRFDFSRFFKKSLVIAMVIRMAPLASIPQLVDCLSHSNKELVFTTTGVLVNLMADWDKRLALKEVDGVQKLINVLKNCDGDWKLASLICQALWNFCIDSTHLYKALGVQPTNSLLTVLVDLLESKNLIALVISTRKLTASGPEKFRRYSKLAIPGDFTLKKSGNPSEVHRSADDSWKGESKGWKFWERQRHIVAFLAFLGFFNVYALRVNLSVGIVAMTSSVVSENGTVLQVNTIKLVKTRSRGKNFTVTQISTVQLRSIVKSYGLSRRVSRDRRAGRKGEGHAWRLRPNDRDSALTVRFRSSSGGQDQLAIGCRSVGSNIDNFSDSPLVVLLTIISN